VKPGRILYVKAGALLRATGRIAHEIAHELRRLNRGGDTSAAPISGARRQQVRAFKTALVNRYREHNRCC
jgi:hypothetical protein